MNEWNCVRKNRNVPSDAFVVNLHGNANLAD